MTDDEYIHVRVPELPDWKIERPIGFHKEQPRVIVVETPRIKRKGLS